MPVQIRKLLQTFTQKDVKDIVFKASPDKPPGPDGFIANLFSVTWSITGQKVTSCIIYFLEI